MQNKFQSKLHAVQTKKMLLKYEYFDLLSTCHPFFHRMVRVVKQFQVILLYLQTTSILQGKLKIASEKNSVYFKTNIFTVSSNRIAEKDRTSPCNDSSAFYSFLFRLNLPYIK